MCRLVEVVPHPLHLWFPGTSIIMMHPLPLLEGNGRKETLRVNANDVPKREEMHIHMEKILPIPTIHELLRLCSRLVTAPPR